NVAEGCCSFFTGQIANHPFVHPGGPMRHLLFYFLLCILLKPVPYTQVALQLQLCFFPCDKAAYSIVRSVTPFFFDPVHDMVLNYGIAYGAIECFTIDKVFTHRSPQLMRQL